MQLLRCSCMPCAGRAKYGGALAAAAKAFEEAAQGGMVLAGTQTFMQVGGCMHLSVTCSQHVVTASVHTAMRLEHTLLKGTQSTQAIALDGHVQPTQRLL
jgi:hypothetical protein